jgi:hypothetical protein
MTHHEEATAPWFLKEEVPGIILFLARNIFPWFHYRFIMLLVSLNSLVIGDGALVLCAECSKIM